MAMDWVFPLSDWAKILIIRRFHHACRFPARVNWHFQLLTHHYIARATLKPPPYLIPDDGKQGCRILISGGSDAYAPPDFNNISHQNGIQLPQPTPKQPSPIFQGLAAPLNGTVRASISVSCFSNFSPTSSVFFGAPLHILDLKNHDEAA